MESSNRKTKQLARMMSHVAIGGFLVGIVSRIGIMLRFLRPAVVLSSLKALPRGSNGRCEPQTSHVACPQPRRPDATTTKLFDDAVTRSGFGEGQQLRNWTSI